jgi:hypothetical protein
LSVLFGFPWRAAEKYVAYSSHGYLNQSETLRGLGKRNIDVKVFGRQAGSPLGPKSDDVAIEVKVGRQANSGRLKNEIAKDVALQKMGYQTVWDFLPNSKGITKPSSALVNNLERNGIDVNIMNYAGNPDNVNVNETGNPCYGKPCGTLVNGGRAWASIDGLLDSGE